MSSVLKPKESLADQLRAALKSQDDAQAKHLLEEHFNTHEDASLEYPHLTIEGLKPPGYESIFLLAIENNCFDTAQFLLSGDKPPAELRGLPTMASHVGKINDAINNSFSRSSKAELPTILNKWETLLAHPHMENFFRNDDKYSNIERGKTHRDCALNLIEQQMLTDIRSIRDMLQDFSDHVILPAMLLTMPDGEAKTSILDNHPQQAGELFSPLNALRISALLLTKRSFCQLWTESPILPMRHSLSWHENVNDFPKRLTPLSLDYAWHSVLTKDVPLDNGMHVTCLTSSDMLRAESKKLSHCVGTSNYDKHCCRKDEKRSHILSLRDKDDNLSSTAEIRINAQPSEHPIANTNLFIHVKQHRTKNDRSASELQDTQLDSFLHKVANGDVALNLTTLGETADSAASRKKSNIPEIYQIIGYEPTWERVEEAFNAFRKHSRGAFAGFDDEGNLLVDENKPFLGGTYREKQEDGSETVIPRSDMSLRDWLKSIRYEYSFMDKDTMLEEFYKKIAFRMPKDTPPSQMDMLTQNKDEELAKPIKAITRAERDELMDDHYYTEMERWKPADAPASHVKPAATRKEGTFVAKGNESFPSENMPSR